MEKMWTDRKSGIFSTERVNWDREYFGPAANGEGLLVVFSTAQKALSQLAESGRHRSKWMLVLHDYLDSDISRHITEQQILMLETPHQQRKRLTKTKNKSYISAKGSATISLSVVLVESSCGIRCGTLLVRAWRRIGRLKSFSVG